MSQRYQAGIITASYNGLKIPDSPTIGTAITGASTAIAVAFTPPVNVGGGAISSYTVTASPDSITFVFQNAGFNYSVDGFVDTTYPDLTLVRGQTYYFNFTNVTSSHPIALRLASTSTTAVPGTTGNNASTGVYGTTVTYQVPLDAPSTIYYQCVFHSSMIGTINIVNPSSVVTGTGASSPITVSGLTNETAYRFTVVATNAYGSSLPSSASNSVAPSATPIALPVYVTQGVSSHISSPTGTVNGTAYKLTGASSNVGLGTTTTLDSHTYHVSDAAGNKWYIAANWGYGTPTRWGGVNRMGFPGSGANSNPAYTTADGIPVYMTNLNGTVINSSTSANAITFTNDYTAANNLLKPGSFQFDAVTYSNSSGPGYANWYADGNKAAQTYPAIITNAFTNWNGGAMVASYDGLGQGSNDTGFLWWRPPLLTKEVMIDFGNNYNNLPCRLFVWNNNTGTLVLVVNFGNFGDINEAAGAINDPYTRTIIIKHTEGFVYFMGDGDPTIAGSHYYLYR